MKGCKKTAFHPFFFALKLRKIFFARKDCAEEQDPRPNQHDNKRHHFNQAGDSDHAAAVTPRGLRS
jgi:hypothetical protein